MEIDFRADWQVYRAPVVLSLDMLGLYEDAIQLVRIQVLKFVVSLGLRW